jgi:hypothetical protein
MLGREKYYYSERTTMFIGRTGILQLVLERGGFGADIFYPCPRKQLYDGRAPRVWSRAAC